MNSETMMTEYDQGFAMRDDVESVMVRPYVSGIILILVLLLSVSWGIKTLMDPTTLPIKSVRVEGEFRHLLPDVLQASVSDVVRGGFFNVNVDAIQAVLFENPWVDQVAVRRIWPDSLNVKVTEKIAIAYWKNDGLLNPDAVFFAPDPATYPDNLPLLSGPDNTYESLLDRYRHIQEKLSEIDLKIKVLNLDDRRAWEFTTMTGTHVKLGRHLLEVRVNDFVQYVYPNLKNDIDRVKRIDMRYTNGFAVQWKDSSKQSKEPEQDNYGQES